MPIYEYLCNKCDHVSESLEKSDITEIQCLQCDGQALRIISATPGFVIGGCSNRVSLSRRKRRES